MGDQKFISFSSVLRKAHEAIGPGYNPLGSRGWLRVHKEGLCRGN
jgi:hypothetical protein